jgi:hypothetical protein
MKRFFLVCCLSLLGAFSLFGEIRADIGADFLIFLSSSSRQDGGVALDGDILPLPEIALYGQFNFGSLHTGVGLRGFSYLFSTALWPALYGEYDLGPVTFHAQLGGGVYMGLDLWGGDPFFQEENTDDFYKDRPVEKENDFIFIVKANPTIIPEVSVWYRFGKFFRVGMGWVTIFLLNPEDHKIFGVTPHCYIAMKMVFPSAAARKNRGGTQRFF